MCFLLYWRDVHTLCKHFLNIASHWEKLSTSFPSISYSWMQPFVTSEWFLRLGQSALSALFSGFSRIAPTSFFPPCSQWEIIYSCFPTLLYSSWLLFNEYPEVANTAVLCFLLTFIHITPMYNHLCRLPLHFAKWLALVFLLVLGLVFSEFLVLWTRLCWRDSRPQGILPHCTETFLPPLLTVRKDIHLFCNSFVLFPAVL